MKWEPGEILRRDARRIALSAMEAVKPDAAVKRALENATLQGNLYLVAVGKAAWQMANAAVNALDRPVVKGIVLTKYHHIQGEIPGVTCVEAGHPVPDENSFRGTQAILDMTAHLSASDTVLFLLSGGGSALFEKPLVSAEELREVTRRMLASGLDIVQMNTVRKRLSAVKGGRFAQWCAPARIEAILLSDILGDPLDMIASGPAAADPSTCVQAMDIAKRNHLLVSEAVAHCLETETPKEITNVHTQVIGSVRELCRAAEKKARELGYEPVFLTDRLCCEADDAGKEIARILKQNAGNGKIMAILAGGETVVHVKGTGLGGRNQQLALAAAGILDGVPNAALISVGSDGTDGPTDAAGGYVDGTTVRRLRESGLDYDAMLKNNDAYHALEKTDGLIITGPTGTNVNDLVVGLTLSSQNRLE
ncbi:MAG: DUF4147 domain-containing protein [Firmicutes bacterium]|nr:DUF4147 domain-containing protein [Bacillota bacterium]